MKLSPVKSIAVHCKGCIYDPKDAGTWRDQTEACSITSCSLYYHRPITYKSKQILKENDLASLSAEQRELIEIRNAQRALNMRNLQSLTGATHAG